MFNGDERNLQTSKSHFKQLLTRKMKIDGCDCGSVSTTGLSGMYKTGD